MVWHIAALVNQKVIINNIDRELLGKSFGFMGLSAKFINKLHHFGAVFFLVPYYPF